MDTALASVLHNANAALEVTKNLEIEERKTFEDFMFTKFILGGEKERRQLLERHPNKPDCYAHFMIENLWWVWKSRGALARGDETEAYPR